MKKPQTIKFTDLEINPIDLNSLGHSGIIPATWTRVQFIMPNDWTALEKVSKWLTENAADDWGSYNYQSETSSKDRAVVVKFKDKNDALMFKLRGGHQCWQEHE